MTDTDQTEEDPMRAFARSLFAPDPDDEPDDPDEQQKPPAGNYVPNEGNNPKRQPGDQDMREFTRELFDNNA